MGERITFLGRGTARPPVPAAAWALAIAVAMVPGAVAQTVEPGQMQAWSPPPVSAGQEAEAPVVIPDRVEAENWPCEYRGKEWITYDARTYPKYVDRKGTLKTFAYRLREGGRVVTGYKKACMYKVVDPGINRFRQALDERTIAYGPYHVWRSDGLMVESGFLVDDVPQKVRVLYDVNGAPSRQTGFRDGKIHGADEYFTEAGRKCVDLYRTGIVVRHTCYHPGGNVVWKDEFYLNGLKHGTITVNFPDGRPESVEQWRHGAYHGLVKAYRMYTDRHFLYTEDEYFNGRKARPTVIWDGEGKRLQ